MTGERACRVVEELLANVRFVIIERTPPIRVAFAPRLADLKFIEVRGRVTGERKRQIERAEWRAREMTCARKRREPAD